MHISSDQRSILEPIQQQLAHLRVETASNHQIKIAVAGDDIEIPRVLKDGYVSEDFIAHIDFYSGAVIIRSVASNRTLALVRSPKFAYDRPDRLRILLQSVSGGAVQALHGGGISWGDSPGILISAKGGSGKSTAVAAAVHDGARTIGDDFLMGNLDPSPGKVRCWSMFSSVRLEASSPARSLFGASEFPELDGKEVFNLSREFPGSVVTDMEIGMLVVPSFFSMNFVTPLTGKEALLAVIPSSVGLSLDKEAAFRSIGKIVSALPAFRVGLTPDIKMNNEFLKQLVAL